ncbi:MAG: hypothetical protein NTX97_07320 [Bacteroidetes bacterium]|nr:hypothetical protein [Bacteroidota bacterium]
MKKLVIVALAVLFLGSIFTSCRPHACVGVTTQIHKVKTIPSERPF